MPGGFGDVMEVDEDVKILAKNMKEKVEETLGETFEIYEPILYTTQVVAGTNYKIKVKVGDEKYVHIKVFVPLPCNNAPNQLTSQEAGKTLADAL